MTERRTREEPVDATVWIDQEQAIIATHDRDGAPVVERLGRGTTEREADFEARAVDEVLHRDHIAVSGPAYARTAFERAYVQVTQRPDRLVDVEPGIDAADAADVPARRLPR